MTDVATANFTPLQLVDPPLPRSADPYWVYLDTLSSDESKRTMLRALDGVAWYVLSGASFSKQAPTPIRGLITGENRAWWAIRYEQAAMVKRALLSLDLAPSTTNLTLTALRQAMRTCWRLGYISRDDCERVCDVPNVKGTRLPAGRAVHADELAALLHVCAEAEADGVIGIRDAAIVTVLYSTGMRRAELTAALIENYDTRERAWKVIGKGNKQRLVYVNPVAAAYLDRWLVAVGDRSGPAFRRVDRWGHIHGNGLGVTSVNRIIDHRREQAELMLLSPHDFRRTFGGEFLDAGGDLAQLQTAMGHASQTTTAGYDRRPGRQIRDVVDRLQIPSGDGS